MFFWVEGSGKRVRRGCKFVKMPRWPFCLSMFSAMSCIFFPPGLADDLFWLIIRFVRRICTCILGLGDLFNTPRGSLWVVLRGLSTPPRDPMGGERGGNPPRGRSSGNSVDNLYVCVLNNKIITSFTRKHT